MDNKKGALSLQVVIIAVVLLIVLVVLIVIFTRGSGQFSGGTSDCLAKGGACYPSIIAGDESPVIGSPVCEDTNCVYVPRTSCEDTKATGLNKKHYCLVPLFSKEDVTNPE